MSGESSGSGRFASPASACLRIGRGQLPAPAARIPQSGTADREPARLSPLASGAPEEPPAHQVLLHDSRATAQTGPARPVVDGETPGLFVTFRHGLGAQIGRNRPDHPAVDVVGHGGREVVPQRAQALRGDLASGRQGRDAGAEQAVRPVDVARSRCDRLVEDQLADGCPPRPDGGDEAFAVPGVVADGIGPEPGQDCANSLAVELFAGRRDGARSTPFRSSCRLSSIRVEVSTPPNLNSIASRCPTRPRPRCASAPPSPSEVSTC